MYRRIILYIQEIPEEIFITGSDFYRLINNDFNIKRIIEKIGLNPSF
jgi:hypothetical protein